jgi:tetratricopeptide (TPR) repeat protein
MNILKHMFYPLLGIALLCSANAFAGVDEDVSKLQREWERIKYQTAPAEQQKGFELLTAEAGKVSASYPNRAEPLIWHGIIEASYAGAKGGLGALSLVKNARRNFEQALEINPNALNGSAYTSLGSLYYQVPGWPIGFGDNKKALEFLEKGLALNPDGIDPNYFYGDFLFRTGDLDNAERVLRKALQAPPRAGRKLADEGRRKEIKDLLDKIAEKRNKQS